MFLKFFLVYSILHFTPKLLLIEADTKIDQSLKTLTGAKTNCVDNEFQCKNRRCVPLSVLCDNADDCGDNSDENGESCKIVRTTSCPKENQQMKCENEIGSRNLSDGNAESYFFLCPWHRVPKNESNLLQCRNGVWTPSVTRCKRLCQNVTFFAESVNCYRNGNQQNCTAPFLTGTEIQVRCTPDYKATFEKVRCDDNGEWDHDRVECVPICGKLTKHKLNYVQNVRPAERREFPWNVGLYGKDKSVPICSATIVSPSLALTTATCVQELQNRSALIPRENIEVIVAKNRRETSKKDDELQKSYRVRKIFLLEDEVSSHEVQNITNNLALVKLDENINASVAVYPICLNWNKNDKWIPTDNSEGQVTTWRIRYENGTSGRTSTLAKIAVLYSSRASCLKNNSQKNLNLTHDQFCVKIGKSSPYPYQTGSAWTYVEKNTNLHFLGGLLNSDYRREVKNVGNPDVTFVDLNYPLYIDWINEIRKQVDTVSREISFSFNQQNIDCRSSFSLTSSEAGITTGSSVTVISTEKSVTEKTDNCTLPDVASLNATNYVLDCRSVEEKCRNIGEETIVSLASKLSLTCKPGYVLQSNESAACVNNRWTTFPLCIKTCPPLVPKNVNVECFLENSVIDCHEIVKAGTRVMAKCYKNYEPKNISDSAEIHCKSDGVWSGSLRTCIMSKSRR